MKDSIHISNQTELEQLIKRYFEGETTVQEETALRHALASQPWQSEAIDEARFTLGYFAAHGQQKHKADALNMRRRYAAIAASVAICISIGGYALWQHQQNNGMCIAYVNGKVINNNDQVLALMHNDLTHIDEASQGVTDFIVSDMSDMGDASQSLSNQLSILGDAIE